MITPAPTTKIAPTLARGVLQQVVPATATKPGYVVIAVPNTSYELHLAPAGGMSGRDPALDAPAHASVGGHAALGKRIIGTIKARARRVDVVQSGGRFIEPVAGRPRRVQGLVVAAEPSTNSIVVNAGVPVTLTLTDSRQRAEQFEAGAFVSCDVMDGATFSRQG